MNKKNVFAAAVSIAAGLLAGCQTIDNHNRVPDWPELKIIEHRVPTAEMWERCQRYVPRFSLPAGCTMFYFSRGEAHIYVSDTDESSLVLQHERLHARGYDHIGSTGMARALQSWRSSQQNGRDRTFDMAPTGAGRAHSLAF